MCFYIGAHFSVISAQLKMYPEGFYFCYISKRIILMKNIWKCRKRAARNLLFCLRCYGKIMREHMYIRMNGERENVIQTIVINVFLRWCFDSYLTLEKDRLSFIWDIHY